MTSNPKTAPKTGRHKPRPDEASRMAKALSHPLRVELLARLGQRVASPVDLARELEQPIGNVSYHVRTLLDLGVIELVETRQRRGAIEHFYRATALPILEDEGWETLGSEARRANVLHWFRESFAGAARAIDAGHLDRDRVHVTHTPLMLDEEGRREVHDRLRDVLDRALELAAEAAARDDEGGNREPTTLLLAHYDAVPLPPRAVDAAG